MIQAQLGPWPSVVVILAGAALAVLGVYLPNGAPLLTLGASVVGGILGALQAQRPPTARTRATDRIPTAAGGHPLIETTPPPYTGPERRGRSR